MQKIQYYHYHFCFKVIISTYDFTHNLTNDEEEIMTISNFENEGENE